MTSTTRPPPDKGGVPEGPANSVASTFMCGPLGFIGERDHLFHNNGDGTFTDVSVKLASPTRRAATFCFGVRRRGRRRLARSSRRQRSMPNYLYLNQHDGTFADRATPPGSPSTETAARSLHGHRRRRLQAQWQVRHLHHHFLRRLQNSLPQRRHAEFTESATRPVSARQLFLSSAGATDSSTSTTTAGWISSSPTATFIPRPTKPTGAPHTPSARCSSTTSTAESSSRSPGSQRQRPHCQRLRPWRRLRRPLQRRPDRCRHQQHGLRARPAPQRQSTIHHWLKLKLVGGPKSPRDAVGATVYITAMGVRQRADVFSGGSYASSPTCASISAWASPPQSTNSKFTGPAALSNRSLSPASTEFLL